MLLGDVVRRVQGALDKSVAVFDSAVFCNAIEHFFQSFLCVDAAPFAADNVMPFLALFRSNSLQQAHLCKLALRSCLEQLPSTVSDHLAVHFLMSVMRVLYDTLSVNSSDDEKNQAFTLIASVLSRVYCYGLFVRPTYDLTSFRYRMKGMWNANLTFLLRRALRLWEATLLLHFWFIEPTALRS